MWVNNAGVDRPAMFRDTGPELWRVLIDVNYVGVLNGCRAALEALAMAPDGGSIVSIASETARTGGWGEAVYAGAKAAVVGFTKSLAREVAREGIRVNCVSPSVTQTAFEAGLREDPDWGAHRRGRPPRDAHAPGRPPRGGGRGGRVPGIPRGGASSPARCSRSTAGW